MKKGTILRNLWAGHETYFICMNFPVRVGRAEGKKTGGYSLVNIDGKWKFARSDYYVSSLRDTEHFPVVGYVDFDGMVIDGILKSIGREPPKTNADRIRTMIDEELAHFLTWNVPDCVNFCDDARCGCKWNCKHSNGLMIIRDWLKQPVNED